MVFNKVLIGLLISTSVQAGEFFMDGGVGVFNSGITSLAETKTLMVGLQHDLYGPFKLRTGVGGWTDCAGHGRAPAAYFSEQLGFEVTNSGGTYASIFTGPTFVTATDAYLGSMFEFQEDVHLGISDPTGNAFGFFYRHLSDAGLFPGVNLGRDMMGVEFKFPY